MPTSRLPPPGFLLFVGSLGLLSVLTGVAAFSVVVSLIFNVFYFVVSGIFGHPQLTKVRLQHGPKHGRSPTLAPFSWWFSPPSAAQRPGEGERKAKGERGPVMDPNLSSSPSSDYWRLMDGFKKTLLKLLLQSTLGFSSRSSVEGVLANLKGQRRTDAPQLLNIISLTAASTDVL